MEMREQQLQELNLEIKNQLKKFENLQDEVEKIGQMLNQRLISNIKLLLKEVKDISLISVTAAPFSLTILLSNLKINIHFLAFSFILFMINVLILNIGIWYINKKFLKSTSSQVLENVSMGIYAIDVNNNALEITKRVDALSNFLKNRNNLKSKIELEPYTHIKSVQRIRLLGIILLSLAILLLVISIVSSLVRATRSFDEANECAEQGRDLTSQLRGEEKVDVIANELIEKRIAEMRLSRDSKK